MPRLTFSQLRTIRTEIDTDPIPRTYSGMTNAQIADSMNAVNRDAPGTMAALLEYLIGTRAHTNQGTDTAAANSTPSTILGRLLLAAEQTAIGADPFGAGGTKVMNSRELHSAKAFLFMLKEGLSGNVDFTSTTQGDILNDLIGAGVMNTANRTAIIALAQNQVSRAGELGLPALLTADIADAKALP